MSDAPANNAPLLKVEDLRLYYRTRSGPLQAVDGVSFDLGKNRTMVIVGESGCGKSSLSRAILRLLPRNIHTFKGQVILNGTDVMKFGDERFRRQVRWVRAAWVPQAAQNSLNPVVRIGEQIAEPLLTHRKVKGQREARERTKLALERVRVPTDFIDRYPFELSGGMRQRVAIAMALITDPELVVMDEPTSALDVLTQGNIMNLLKRVKQETVASFILITHDIATSSEVADDAAVMYAGEIVELSTAGEFYREPLHPYSQKLMASVPTIREDKKLEFIPGQPPGLIDPPTGCRFKARCPYRFDKCDEHPPLLEVEGGRRVRCWLYDPNGEQTHS
jgi:peptide/nickel transport system ATP-binding protein